MYLSRLASSAFVIAVAAIATMFACGGDDGGTHGSDPDAKVYNDAAPMQMDAPPAGAPLGKKCTPSQTGTQGDCPTGYECLNLTDASGPWCSKKCTSGASDDCKTGYTGPGIAACILGVTPPGGGAAQDYCAVKCGGTGVCGSNAACNGTCPGSMVCDLPLMDTGGATVGSACR